MTQKTIEIFQQEIYSNSPKKNNSTNKTDFIMLKIFGVYTY